MATRYGMNLSNKQGCVSLPASAINRAAKDSMRDRPANQSHFNILKFPATTSILWDREHIGQPIVLELCNPKCPVIFLKEQVLRIVQRKAQDASSETMSTWLTGSVSSSEDGSAVNITIDTVGKLSTDSKQNPSRDLIVGQLSIPCVVVKNNAKSVCSDEDYLCSLQMVQNRCQSSEEVEFGRLLSVRANCSYYNRGAETFINIDFDVVLPTVKFTVNPIKPLSIMETALTNKIRSDLRMNAYEGEPKSGFLTMDETRKLLLMVEPDDRHNLIGIWVVGVANINDLFVWANLIRYSFCTNLKGRFCMPPKPFLIVNYCSTQSKPEFYECILNGEYPRLEYMLANVHDVIQLNKDKIGNSGDSIELELNPITDGGQKLNIFYSALETFKNKQRIVAIKNAGNGDSTEDIVPRMLPVPAATEAPVPESSVPDVTIINDDGKIGLMSQQQKLPLAVGVDVKGPSRQSVSSRHSFEPVLSEQHQQMSTAKPPEMGTVYPTHSVGMMGIPASFPFPSSASPFGFQQQWLGSPVPFQYPYPAAPVLPQQIQYQAFPYTQQQFAHWMYMNSQAAGNNQVPMLPMQHQSVVKTSSSNLAGSQNNTMSPNMIISAADSLPKQNFSCSGPPTITTTPSPVLSNPEQTKYVTSGSAVAPRDYSNNRPSANTRQGVNMPRPKPSTATKMKLTLCEVPVADTSRQLQANFSGGSGHNSGLTDSGCQITDVSSLLVSPQSTTQNCLHHLNSEKTKSLGQGYDESQCVQQIKPEKTVGKMESGSEAANNKENNALNWVVGVANINGLSNHQQCSMTTNSNPKEKRETISHSQGPNMRPIRQMGSQTSFQLSSQKDIQASTSCLPGRHRDDVQHQGHKKMRSLPSEPQQQLQQKPSVHSEINDDASSWDFSSIQRQLKTVIEYDDHESDDHIQVDLPIDIFDSSSSCTEESYQSKCAARTAEQGDGLESDSLDLQDEPEQDDQQLRKIRKEIEEFLAIGCNEEENSTGPKGNWKGRSGYSKELHSVPTVQNTEVDFATDESSEEEEYEDTCSEKSYSDEEPYKVSKDAFTPYKENQSDIYDLTYIPRVDYESLNQHHDYKLNTRHPSDMSMVMDGAIMKYLSDKTFMQLKNSDQDHRPKRGNSKVDWNAGNELSIATREFFERHDLLEGSTVKKTKEDGHKRSKNAKCTSKNDVRNTKSSSMNDEKRQSVPDGIKVYEAINKMSSGRGFKSGDVYGKGRQSIESSDCGSCSSGCHSLPNDSCAQRPLVPHSRSEGESLEGCHFPSTPVRHKKPSSKQKGDKNIVSDQLSLVSHNDTPVAQKSDRMHRHTTSHRMHTKTSVDSMNHATSEIRRTEVTPNRTPAGIMSPLEACPSSGRIRRQNVEACDRTLNITDDVILDSYSDEGNPSRSASRPVIQNSKRPNINQFKLQKEFEKIMKDLEAFTESEHK